MMLYLNYPVVRRHSRPVRRLDQLANPNQSYTEREHRLPLDVEEKEDAFIITAIVPGLNPEDINIQVLKDRIELSYEFSPEGNGRYLLQERLKGQFSREITLPTPLNADKVEASLEKGILTLQVAKAEEALPKKIKVN